ncbi:Uncharacterised protein [Sphingobacterium spiritivorum]|uniref:Uncharacterized protein n=1 Tax=Sphingobacterium spiritivorum TaxID=258 RepID=A0A380CS53_SPHSI|nr:Uncharacterised protein [Sphingobacterium spiritivorum]
MKMINNLIINVFWTDSKIVYNKKMLFCKKHIFKNSLILLIGEG